MLACLLRATIRSHCSAGGGPIFVDLSHLLARSRVYIIHHDFNFGLKQKTSNRGRWRQRPILSEAEREREKDNSFHDLTSQLERSDIGNRFLHKTNGSVDIEFDLSDYLPT